KNFNRKTFLNRDAQQVRKDILAAKKFTSTYLFDFDAPNEELLAYCQKIWAGIDLSSHFCILCNLIPPSDELVAFASQTFKYVYWDFDIACLSERHRKELFAKKLVKPQPTDAEIFAFFAECEKYPNTEVRVSLIAGLPFFTAEDIEESERVLSYLLKNYTCLTELHCGRLHAQPGAPILQDTGIYQMHSDAVTYFDFLEYSKKNFHKNSSYPGVEYFEYPYIYYNDTQLNSKINQHYWEMNRLMRQHKENKGKTFVKPTSEIEKQLADIWKKFLTVGRIGTRDNFFDLGGNSFLLMQVNAEIEKLYPGCLSITDFFAYPTITRLAGLIQKKQSGDTRTWIELKTLSLPGDYFHRDRDQRAGDPPGELKFELAGDIFKSMDMISRRQGVEISYILLAGYVYLFARISGKPLVACQGMCREKGGIIPFEVDLSTVTDFPAFFQALKQLHEVNATGSYDVEKLGLIKLKKPGNEAAPFFYRKELLGSASELTRIFDIVLEVEAQQDTRICLVCRFNKRLSEEKMEAFVHQYVSLNHFIIDKCLENVD
ncbi:MAG: phosphopantetheine-binding protein, partial [Acidobacteria bacterium]|nr:phosphopantetheine-binding protein [Acidobacteriota bacterium]